MDITTVSILQRREGITESKYQVSRRVETGTQAGYQQSLHAKPRHYTELLVCLFVCLLAYNSKFFFLIFKNFYTLFKGYFPFTVITKY